MGRYLTLLIFLALGVGAQAPDSPPRVHELPERPVFHVEVVEQVTVAVNYRHRSGATRIDFRGTPLMPLAEGYAKVASKKGYIEIDAVFRNLKPAIQFGAEYLTFVLWAITPEGRAANLGEIQHQNGRSKLNVTTELQVFGLVVTAEPYFAVRQPSDLVVLENEVRPDTKGKFEVIDAKYELLKRGQYEPLSNPLNLTVDASVPIELYEARNAVQIASTVGARQYASDTFLKAERALRQAEAYLARKAGNKPVAMLAREAVQTAEDARELTVRRREAERARLEREAAARREAEAKAKAEQEALRRAAAEQERREREEAERLARARAEEEAAARRRLEEELKKAREAAREAEEIAERARRLLEERTAGFGEERAQWELERQRREAEAVERDQRLVALERAELRMRIYGPLSRVLFTRDTEEGLVLELTPALFDPGEPRLTAEGAGKLATLAGILLAYPSLAIELRPASDEPADALEQARASAVRSYLLERGLVADRLWTANDSPAEGPPQNPSSDTPPQEKPLRLLVTGEAIRTLR